MNLLYLVIGILVTMNISAFGVMAQDKRRSLQHGEATRTPEGVLFFFAAALGAIGIYAGMVLLRHKIRKWYFAFGIPLLIVQNVATVYVCRMLFVL